MKILYATSEAVPFCKTGGLADVAGSLPPALAAAGGASYSYYKRLFGRYYGLPPSKYLANLRLRRACEILESGRMSVEETARSARSSSSMELPQQRLCLLRVQNGLQERIGLRLITGFDRGCRLPQPLSIAGREKPQQLLPGLRAEDAAELCRIGTGRLARR